MALKRYSDGAWNNVSTIKRYSNGAWVNCSFVKKYVNGAWEIIYPSERYLIKDGAIKAGYSVIPLWIDYYSGGNLTDNITENTAAGYTNIYSSGYSDMAVMVFEAMDLRGYSKLNIDADAQCYLDSSSYANAARAGVLSSIPEGIAKGSPARNVSEVVFNNIFYTYTGVAKSYNYYAANVSVDISKVNITGYIFIGISSWNYATERSNLRIKNLWLS